MGCGDSDRKPNTDRTPDLALIRTAGLTKRYARVTALDALNLELEPGIVGLVGANGCSHSTPTATPHESSTWPTSSAAPRQCTSRNWTTTATTSSTSWTTAPL